MPHPAAEQILFLLVSLSEQKSTVHGDLHITSPDDGGSTAGVGLGSTQKHEWLQ